MREVTGEAWGVSFTNLRAATPQIGSLIETTKEACGAKAYGAGGGSTCVVFVFEDFEKREEVKNSFRDLYQVLPFGIG